jgi:hypothetical protein
MHSKLSWSSSAVRPCTTLAPADGWVIGSCVLLQEGMSFLVNTAQLVGGGFSCDIDRVDRLLDSALRYLQEVDWCRVRAINGPRDMLRCVHQAAPRLCRSEASQKRIAAVLAGLL